MEILKFLGIFFISNKLKQLPVDPYRNVLDLLYASGTYQIAFGICKAHPVVRGDILPIQIIDSKKLFVQEILKISKSEKKEVFKKAPCDQVDHIYIQSYKAVQSIMGHSG